MVKVLRWICKDCDKKWIHPVETCIYCNKSIEKQIGQKTKVVGFTKIHIPNPLHPIVPYNVLILEDEHGNRMPKKTIKDYKLGEEYIDKPDSSDNSVSIVKIKYDIYEAVTEALELIGDIDVKGKSVLLKPNFSVPGYPYLGLGTNPKVLDALITYLKDKGATKISMAEQSFFLPTEKAIAKYEIKELCEKHNVDFIDISKTEFIEKQEREFKFEVSKILNDYDILINVPCIKTDMYTNIDGAFENLSRFLSKKSFDEISSDPKKAVLALSVLPNLVPKFITLGDATIGSQGNGPGPTAEPGFYNMIFASRNPVVHDKVIQEVFCLRKTPYVELASKLGLGEGNITKINFIGNELNSLKRDIKQPIGSSLIKK